MAKSYLQMKYHPAKKEVEFRRFENGKEKVINKGRLLRYVNMKGKFVLQDQGNAFFEDIARAFDSVKTLEMQVVTTKLDYNDLVQMIDYYNQSGNAECKITPTLIAELPDMNQTFKDVTEFGKKAVSILENHSKRLLDIDPIAKKTVKECADGFAEQIRKEVKNIKDKIESLRDNKVSLCFAGVYSSGKSSLINAIIGYKILPESISSETAKMFQIRSPKTGESIKIICTMNDEKTVLEWVENKETLVFTEGPNENEDRRTIQKKLNESKGIALHEQMYMILGLLNKMKDVSGSIEIVFPIPLDSDAVQFMIYDTPGTDSNYAEHQEILTDALSKQTQSILIFVASPTKLEGSGNDALLKYLGEAEEKNTKTSIDLDRSLFVINFSDTIRKKAREELRLQEIKYKEEANSTSNCSIQLFDKKLFFTSATIAYAAKAKKNKIASSDDEYTFEHDGSKMLDEFGGRVYLQNRCATSERATEMMHSECEKEFKDAIDEKDEIRAMEVCSGIYALEREIKEYGEKYASTVKAYAIIDSVNRVLFDLSKEANSLEESNQKSVNEIENEINELQKTIDGAIKTQYDARVIPEGKSLPDNVLKKLKLDKETLSKEINSKAETDIENLLEKEKFMWFETGKVKYKEGDIQKIRNVCNQKIRSYITDFLKNRQEILEQERDDFLQCVKDEIKKNGEISDAAKEVFFDIPAPKVPKYEEVKKVDETYKEYKYTEGFWIFKGDFLKKEEFMKKIKTDLSTMIQKLADDYKKDYKRSLEAVLSQIERDFKSNLDKYSLKMNALIEDKEATMQLVEKIKDVAQKLGECEQDLNDIIWEEVK